MSEDINRALGRIEGKLDAALEIQKEHGEKIETLTAIKNYVIGIVTVFSMIGAVIGSKVSAAVAGFFHH